MKKYLLLICALLVSFITFSQTTLNEGKIKFAIEYPESQLDQQSMAMYPADAILYFKNTKSRMEMVSAVGTTTIISDHEKHIGTMLMEMMGNKFAIDFDTAAYRKNREEAGKPTIKFTDDTKKIAGYLCKRAEVAMSTKDGESTHDIWYTTEIVHDPDYPVEGIDGCALEYTFMRNGMVMKMTAKKVEQVPVEDSKFTVPDDFKKMTQEEMKAMWGGGRR